MEFLFFQEELCATCDPFHFKRTSHVETGIAGWKKLAIIAIISYIISYIIIAIISYNTSNYKMLEISLWQWNLTQDFKDLQALQ